MPKTVFQPLLYNSAEAIPDTLHPLDIAVLRTVAYADVFNFPLTTPEITRYLIGMNASKAAVQVAINRLLQQTAYLEHHSPLYVLRGHSEIIAMRLDRRRIAKRMLPVAWQYGQRIAGFPFVRMVAITGALAVENAVESDDIDYFIVTTPGRLWLCRAMIILLVRLARLEGHIICPNFLLSERVLHLDDQNIFSAHELAQMIPVSGSEVYERMLAENQWVAGYLPNMRLHLRGPSLDAQESLLKRAVEWMLLSPVGAWLEKWEMNRKIDRFRHQGGENLGKEVRFSPDRCQGHFHGHGKRTLDAYTERLADLGQVVTLVR